MSLFGTGRREGILAVSLLALCAIAVHLPGLLFGAHRSLSSPALGTPLHAELEGASNHTILLPALASAGAVARAGDVPLWNRDARFGEPFCVSGANVWYPPYWLAMVGFGPWSLDLLFALHTLIACIGMFRFLRVMPVSRYAAFLGGVSYGMGWFLTAGFDRLPEAAAAALLPIALECTWRCLASRRRRPTFVPALGITVAAMFAAGSTTTAWFGVLLCVAMLVAGMSAIEREHRLVALGMAVIAAAIVVLLTAPIWLDWWQLRGHLHVEDHGSNAARLRPAGLLAAFAPGLFQGLDGAGPTLLRDVNPAADPLELALYPGALVLFLLVLGLFRPKRNYQELFWLSIAGAGLVLAVDSPLHTILGWSAERPGAGLVWFHLAAVVLAAHHLETFFDAPIARPLATPLTCALAFVLTGCVLVFGGVAPATGETLLGWAFGGDGVSGAELAAAREHLFERSLAPALALAAVALAFCYWRRFGILRFKPLLAVIALVDVGLIATTAVPRNSLEPATAGRSFDSGLGDADRSRSVRVGREARQRVCADALRTDAARLDTRGRAILHRTAEYLAAIDPSCVRTSTQRSEVAPLLVPELLDHPLLERAHVDAARTTRLGGTTLFEPLLARPGPDGQPVKPGLDGTTLLVRSTPSERLRLAFLLHPVADRAAALQQLRASHFPDPLGAMCEVGSEPESTTAPSGPAAVQLVDYRANRVVVRADVGDGRGLLALADAMAPGWEVAVDGQPARLLASDVAFRSVMLPPGRHEVVFRYRPWAWTIGVPMLAAGLVLCIGAAFVAVARRRS